MYPTPDRQINPPSFYVMDEEPTKKEKVAILLEKAESKINKILNSKCLIYQLAGGGIQRDIDIERAGDVYLRIENYYKSL